MENNLNKTIAEIFESQYVIPLYQRNFAWKEEQIGRMLKDIYAAFCRGQNYYLGSLVVRKCNDDRYEVIDGQQRLTALSLIMKEMGKCNVRHLSYDSRPQVERFFDALYDNQDIKELDHPSLIYLKEAVDIIHQMNLCEEEEGMARTSIQEAKGKGFDKYFTDRVMLLLVELPEDTDEATYFEIMNNRGEQLQEHEILKAQLISSLRGDKNKEAEYSMIWDACSQMNYPIQRLFKASKREWYFGGQYDGFITKKDFEDFFSKEEKKEDTGERSEGPSLLEILDPESQSDLTAQQEAIETEPDNVEDENRYTSIIDFPNFIMHVFRVVYNKAKPDATGRKDIPLDSKFMLKVYQDMSQEIKFDPVQFLYELLRLRTWFDRYVVKTINKDDNSEEDSIAWSLKRPVYKDEKVLKFEDTYSDNPSDQHRIVKALSMLQVSFRSPKYKNWLQEVLQFFSTHSENFTAKEYIEKLDAYALERFVQLDIKPMDRIEGTGLSKVNSYSKGVDTPHFLFNFIDYLYWVESRLKRNEINYIDSVKDFDFKYWNSVEHHLSQHKAEPLDHSEEYVDNLGNLCLINRSSNSRLSDRDVKEKVEAYSDKNMGANRQIIYAMTRNKGFIWKDTEIKEHYNDLVDLLNKRVAILNHEENKSDQE